jgi:hypothetical protein
MRAASARVPERNPTASVSGVAWGPWRRPVRPWDTLLARKGACGLRRCFSGQMRRRPLCVCDPNWGHP